MAMTPELLSPAGDMEKMKIALAYGADAVYLSGKSFGLRAGSGNFTPEELRTAVSYVHERKKRCYITVNIFAHPSDFSELDEELLFYQEIGADALIVSDAGIFRKCRTLIPDMEIHISTQASVTNAEGCMFWYEQGAKRVVLARELTLAEIKEIRKAVPLDMSLECFIHGAMCMAYSGRCLLSNFFTGRASNHGACAQPCRWKYEIREEKRPDEPLISEEDERGTYLFNSRDMSMIEYIPQLMEAGIDSFKIEGRIKGAFYAATTAWSYKNAMNRYLENPEKYEMEPIWKEQLERTVHRHFGTGFYFDKPAENAQIFEETTYIRPAYVVGMVTGYDKEKGLLQISQRNKFYKGDTLGVLQPDGRFERIEAKEIYDACFNPAPATPKAKEIYYVPSKKAFPEYSFISVDGDKDK